MALDADQAIDDLVLPLPVNEQPMEEAYAVESVIGEGSYSTVHAATRRCNGEPVVVKAIRVDTLDTDERKNALQEAQTLSHLRHTNIIRYHDVRYHEHESTLYIIMEHAAGGDLGALIKQQARSTRPFTEDFILLAFVQITLALSHVHARGFLHRDVKPSNVFLLGHDNIVKLGDFGLAKMVHATDNLAETTVGTPCYRSPEMCENKPYCAKSDIWSLGCLLYELTTLKRAFEGNNLTTLVVNILYGRVSPVPSRFSVHLRSLIRSMMAQNPARRPTADAILKLPWMQPYLHQYSELMRRQLPESNPAPARVSDGSACSADAMTLAMPPTVHPLRTTAAGSPIAAVDRRPQIQQPISDTRTKAACREVRRLLGSVHASLSARLKETPSAAGASFRCGVTKGKAAVAGARMRVAATHQIRSFCPSDVTDVQIAPVLRPTWVPEQTDDASPNNAGSSVRSMEQVPEMTKGSQGVKELSEDSAQFSQPKVDLDQPDLDSLSSLSSICSQPTRTDDTPPWGSIVPMQGMTLSSPQPRPVGLLHSAAELPPERVRPSTPPLPRHSVSPDLPPRTAKNKPPRLAFVAPSRSSCSIETVVARADLRSARDTHKDNRHAKGQQIVSPAWLRDNLAALDQMQGALSASMEFRQAGESDRVDSHSLLSSRASPTPTNEMDTCVTAPAGEQAAATSPTSSLSVPQPQPGHAMDGLHVIESNKRRETGSPCADCSDGAKEDVCMPPKRRPTHLESQQRVSRMRSGLSKQAGLHRAAQADLGKVAQVPGLVLSSSSSAVSLRPARNSTNSHDGKRLHKGKPDIHACPQRPQLARSNSAVAAAARHCTHTEGKDKARPRLGNRQCEAVPNRTVKRIEPSKAKERAEARKRAAEMQAAHRFALKHVQARVRREDIKNRSSLTSHTSRASPKQASRPDAPAFVIPATPHNDKHNDNDACASACKSPAKSPHQPGDAQQPAQAHRRERGQKQGGGASASSSGNRGTMSGSGGPERNIGKMMSCRLSGTHVATFKSSPDVEIFVPPCSPQGSSGEVAPRAAAPRQTLEASFSQPPALDIAATEIQPAANVISSELPERAITTCVARCLSSTLRRWDARAEGCQTSTKRGRQKPVIDRAAKTCVTAPSLASTRCIRGQNLCLKKLAMDNQATPLQTTGHAQGELEIRHVEQITKAAPVRNGRGAGSSPGRFSSENRTEAGKATAAKVEELRMRLEAQLGEDRLLSAIKFLDSGAGMAPAGVVPPELEALLAPHTHFAYAVYRLRMMEDMVFG